ncbi:hypothetical protein CNR22_11360 [Sphingobacteriaceae bacterium]|nr:hypothetical protein CNR22_11360 [Sphingobacteriaceae bacterium]
MIGEGKCTNFVEKKMKTLFLPVISAFLWMNIQITSAQVSSYTFSQSLQSYGNPNNGSLVGTTMQDDDVNTAVLPFNFVYNGTTYTTVNVCSNGYLSFGTLSGFEYQAISDMSTSNILAPFAQDMFMGTVIKGDLSSGSNSVVNVSSLGNLSVGDSLMDIFFDFGGSTPIITAITGNTIVLNINSLNTVSNQDMFIMNGVIRQNVTGTSPNRICEFEFRNMCRFTVYDESIHFKVKLYETTNKIEFLYGNTIPGLSSASPEVGLKGANNLDYNSRLVNSSNSWSTSIASSFISDVCDFTPNSAPDLGLSYVWSPTVCVNPTLTISSSNPSVCVGQTVTLTAMGAASYSWSTGSTSLNTSVSPTVNTTYTVTGFVGTCSSSLTVLQSVTPLPTLSIAQTKTLICKGNSATLTASGAATYSWSNGSNASSIVVSPTVTTTYTLTGANSTCVSKKIISQVVSNCTGIDEAKTSVENLNAYPNPFANKLTVQNPFSRTVSLKLMDMTGRLVYENTIEAGTNQAIDTERLNTGMYVLLLEEGDNKLAKKVIKH